MNDIAEISDIRRSAIEIFNQGVTAAQSDKNLAYRLIGSSVEIDSTFQPGWFQIGCNNSDLGLLHAAVAAFRRSLELNPNDIRSMVNLGHRLYHLGDMKGARYWTEKAIKLAPEQAFPWCNLSLIEGIEANMQKSIKAARKAYDLDRSCEIEMSLAFALMHSGEYAEGLKHFESRYEYRISWFLNYPWPQWRGEDISDKVLLLQADQGLGDTLSFARFIPLAANRAGRLVLLVQGELLRLFNMLFQRWPNVTVLPLGQPFPQAHYWTSSMSLPVALGLTAEEIRAAPNLPLPQLYTPPVWKTTDRRLHIGIAWAGNPGNEIDRWRSIDVRLLLDLYRVPGIQLYSLQVGDRAQDVHNVGAVSLIKDLAPFIRDVTDTMSIMRDLDLIICIDTALGHIAGAMEKSCWLLVARNGGDFRIGRSGEKSLWNPNHRVFRQLSDADWRPVVDRIVRELKERLK